MLGVSQSRVLTALLSSVAALAVAVGLVLVAPAAQAGSSLLCSGYAACKRAGYDHFGYESKQRTSYWRMYTGTNCTNYVAYRLVTTNGMPNVRPKSGVGNARDWGKAMASVTDSTPTVGSVAWWGKTGNHVAYVEKVASPTEIIVSESNWGRTFDHRRITKSGSGWPDGFIHFDDPAMKNTAKPTISGSGKVGEKLTAKSGSWSPTPSSYRYEWRADGKAVADSTTSTFTPGPAHLAKSITVRVTAVRSGHPATAATSAAVVATPGSLTVTADPSISGTPRVDSTLTAAPGSSTPRSSSTSYTWSADGEPIAGATSSTLDVGPDLAGTRISVSTTSSTPGYAPVTRTSAATKAVAPGTLRSVTAPTISGKAAVDSVLTASPGTWSRSDVEADYAWLVAGTPVPGATASTFRPRAQDAGKTISVTVTARRAGYTDAQRTSTVTSAVTVKRFDSTARPTIEGSAQVAGVLTARTPTWSPTATFTYQWSVDGKAVPGADEATFRPRPEDVGHRVSVTTTGSRAGFVPVSQASSSTAPVTAGAIVADQPRLRGAVVPGRTVSITLGAVPAGTTHTYQWLLDGKAISGGRGATYTPTTSQLGRELSVRVGYRRPGFTTSTQKTTGFGVKAISKLTVSTARSGSSIRVAVRVNAAGVARESGKVVVRVGSARRTVTVTSGRAVTTFTKRTKGTHRIAVEYSGSATTRPASTTARSVKVP